MNDLSASAELLALIEDHRDLVVEAYSQANDLLKPNAADNKTGLLALLQLTALEGSEFQGLLKAEEVIELLSIEQLQHDVNLLNDLIPGDIKRLGQQEAMYLAVVAFDVFLHKQGGLDSYKKLCLVSEHAEKSHAKNNNAVVGVFYHRMSLFAAHGFAADREILAKSLQNDLSNVSTFPLDIFSLVSVARANRRLALIAKQILSLGQSERVEQEQMAVVGLMREVSTNVWNDFEHHSEAEPAARFLHETSLVLPIMDSTAGEKIAERHAQDGEVLFNSQANEKRIAYGSALLFLLCCWVGGTLQLLENWYQLATAEKNFELVISAVSNPQLQGVVASGDVVTRVNGIVSPSLMELKLEVARSSDKVELAVLSAGESRIISINLMQDEVIGSHLGLYFFTISPIQKLICIVLLLYALHMLLGVLSFQYQSFAVLQPTSLYLSNLLWLPLALWIVLSDVVGFSERLWSLEIWSIILLLALLIVSRSVIVGHWILVGWVNVFRRFWRERKTV